MRFAAFSVLVALLLIAGCAPESPVPERFDVTFSRASQDMFYDHEKEKPLEVLTFLMTNNEDFALDCSVVLNLDNSTDTSVKKAGVGVLEPGLVKNVSMTYGVLGGDTEIRVDTLCDRVE